MDINLFDEAFKSEQPLMSLREIVKQLIAQGNERDAILKNLEQFRDLLHRQQRDQEDDVVLEVMDFVAGWCSPHMKL